MPTEIPIATTERAREAATGPDPAEGVFETVLVLGGEVVELDAHLERLAASVSALYGIEVPPTARPRLVEAAAPLRLGRARLSLAPAAGPPRCEIAAAAVDSRLHFPPVERPTALVSAPLPGGLGPHKWSDRSALPTPPGATALIVEPDGEVLEAGRANVFALCDGILATPPRDGRILPGITRAAVIALARGEGIVVRESRLDRADLLAADGVLLSGSVRGLEAAGSLDGQPLRSPGEVLDRLAGLLRRRWATRRG
ncbi:MAG TPA: aminotransferase class IV [Solirubrobacterales bacterium]